MSRRALSPADQQAQAIRGSRKMIAQGERPGYRVLVRTSAPGVITWVVLGWPELAGTVAARREIERTVRAAIAELLQVPSDAFDVRVDP